MQKLLCRFTPAHTIFPPLTFYIGGLKHTIKICFNGVSEEVEIEAIR